MLSGLNGSGKSAIFDALTFALFGTHRGGSTQAQELINKDSESFSVDFEFALDGVNYRARRTQKRDNKGGSKGTQQIYSDAQGQWVAVEGTQYRDQFKEWVREHIGLTYETFTSSVLLLQGRAEKLLDSTPSGRRDVLAGIVDLERYELLSKKADDERKLREERKKGLENQLAGLAEVDPEELTAIVERCGAAERTQMAAREQVECLHRLEMQAQAWRSCGNASSQQLRRGQAEVLLKDAAAIEKDVARLNDLRTVLPHIQTILERRSTIHQSEQKTKVWTRQLETLREDMAQCVNALDQRATSRKAIRTESNRMRRGRGSWSAGWCR